MRNQSTAGDQGGIHYIDPSVKETDVDGGIVVTGYAWGGEEVDPKSQESLAKKSVDNVTGQASYWVKRATFGPERGFLFNPYSPNFNSDAIKRVVSHLGKWQYTYQKVTSQAFDAYLKFLSPPHNIIHLRLAERSK